MTNQRMRRVNSIMRQVVAAEIERLTDPRLEMVSVTGVETSPDLRHATVFVSMLDSGNAPEALAALESAAARLRRKVGRQVRMKYTPELAFALDEGVVGGERIDAILRNLGEEEQ